MSRAVVGGFLLIWIVALVEEGILVLLAVVSRKVPVREIGCVSERRLDHLGAAGLWP